MVSLDGVSNGVSNGTSNGTQDKSFTGTFQGTFNGTFTGTFTGTLNGSSGKSNLINTTNGQPPNLQDVHEFLVELSKKAGEMIRNAHPLASSVGSKKTGADLVTETDKAVENMIFAELSGKYPHYEFYGEETHKSDTKLTDAPTFVVDPIDGTINFVHTFPNSCVSLGFCINRRPVVGVVYNPLTNILYSAIRGQGAYRNLTDKLPLNGDSLEPLRGLSNALIAVEWGSNRKGPNWETRFRTVEKLLTVRKDGSAGVHSVRSMGSAALDFCAVATGALDLFWEGGCQAWDVCAGWVIVTEAGGIVADANPDNWDPQVDGRRYLAVRPSPNGEGQEEIVRELWANMQGTFDYTNGG